MQNYFKPGELVTYENWQHRKMYAIVLEHSYKKFIVYVLAGFIYDYSHYVDGDLNLFKAL